MVWWEERMREVNPVRRRIPMKRSRSRSRGDGDDGGDSMVGVCFRGGECWGW